MIILLNKIQNAINQTHVGLRRAYAISVLPIPRILNGHSKLCRCAAKNESTLAQSFTMEWTSLEPGHCHCAVCLMEPHMNISKPSVNKSNTGVRTVISHHKRKTLVTLKILFFVEQENA